MRENAIIASLQSGEVARLIPSVADTAKEVRVTSCLLATWTVVPTFADAVLGMCGCMTGSRRKLSCYTEVAFRGNGGDKKLRPDGLVVASAGTRTWCALVESKVGNSCLEANQVEGYLDLARAHGIDAVITISNQLALVPTHHPVQVPKSKLRSVNLYHFSWHALLSQAILIAQGKQVQDPEQAFILHELVRYLQHEASGVVAFSQMGTGWKQICGDIQNGVEIRKSNPSAVEVVENWHQLVRHLALQLSIAVGRPVRIGMSRAEILDPALKLQNGLASLITHNVLDAEFDVPDAAGMIRLAADFRRRTITFTFKVDAPKDKIRPTASINWLIRQLDHLTDSDVLIRAHWPRRIPSTMAPLPEVLQDPKVLVTSSHGEIPVGFELIRVLDLAGRFRGSRTFVEEAEKWLPRFYEEVVQRVAAWSPKPPKIKTQETEGEALSLHSADEGELAAGTEIANDPTPGPDEVGTARIAEERM